MTTTDPKPTAVVELEAAGCTTWLLTPDTHNAIDCALDRLDFFAKDYTAAGDDGRLETIGLRIGVRPDHVIAFYGDWIVLHADGRFTIQPGSEAVR